MKVKIISQKLIKPCTPTPQNLRSYKISYLDERNPPTKIGFVLYYPSKPENISQLEESLAEILPQFYPLAGRYIKQDRLVDCSDEGAEIVRAEAVDVKLGDVVGKITTFQQLSGLLPPQFYVLDEAVTTPLLSVQITDFKCGGLAMGISIAHRIIDVCAFAAFLNAWSNANNLGGGIPFTPSFDGPSLFPWKPAQATTPQLEAFPDDFIVKRFLFDKHAIASLRSKLKPNSNGRAVSRVRVVSAVISKALMGMDWVKSKAFLITQGLNIRDRTIPPLPKYSCGNFSVPLFAPPIPANEFKDIGIQDLVDLMGESTEKTIRDCSEIMSPGADRGKIIDDIVGDFVAELMCEDTSVWYFSDCSKFGLYENDFGWGKPVWVSLGPLPFENMIVLMENKEGDGIEAWVHLNHSDMSCFEQDEGIKLFAT